MGPHRLLVGDCTDADAWKRLLSTDRPQMVFTDPPYGVSFGSKNYNPKAKQWNAIANDELTGTDLRAFCLRWIKQINDFTQPASPIYVWTASMLEGATILQALNDGGMHMQSQIIWSKTSFALGQADYQWRHEVCWYGWTAGKNHYWNGGRAQSTVWEESKDRADTYKHPTQKPVALAQRAIRNSCPEGGAVIDPFAGSGSTLMACESMARVFLGIELSPTFADVIVNRWARYTGSKAVKK